MFSSLERKEGGRGFIIAEHYLLELPNFYEIVSLRAGAKTD